MFHNQQISYEVVIKQEAATNAATLTSDVFDMKGYRSAHILVHGTTSNNATNNPSVLKLQEADDTNATSFADIAAFVGDGASGFTIPNSPTATTTAPFAVLNVNWGAHRKRYGRVLISPVTTQTFAVIVAKGRSEQMPRTTTTINAAVVVNG